MNTSILRTLLTLGLLASFGPVRLLAQDTATFTIPFDFSVGTQHLAAGEYLIGRAAPSVLRIRTGSGEGVLMALASSASVSTVPGKYVLTFDKVGDRYFLSKLAAENYGLELPQPRVERELLAKRTSRKPITVVASSLK